MSLSATATAVLMTELGFEPASTSTIIPKLNKLTPKGGTALRDSVGFGVGLILRLNQALSTLGSSGIWNFVHIVITDGQDTSSQTTVDNLAYTFYTVNQTIPTSRCSTSFIGIELSDEAEYELQEITEFAGDSCNMYMANDVDLDEIFERISVNIGINREVGVVGVSNGYQSALMIQERNRPVLQVKRNNFAVLLNLDFSGSMAGRRWNSLKNSVRMFLGNMQSGDLVSCCLFNNDVQMLNKIQIFTQNTVNNKLAPISRPVSSQPPQYKAIQSPISRPVSSQPPQSRPIQSVQNERPPEIIIDRPVPQPEYVPRYESPRDTGKINKSKCSCNCEVF